RHQGHFDVRLSSLLAELSVDELAALAAVHVRTDDPLTHAQLCNFLENAIRSPRFVSDFVISRRPPTFTILSALLERPGYRREVDGFREEVLAETQALERLIDCGDLLVRDQQCQLYRRALCEARRNDLAIDDSEAALLAVLRREQGIA